MAKHSKKDPYKAATLGLVAFLGCALILGIIIFSR